MDKNIRLAKQALQLKKGWLVLMALCNQGKYLTEADLFIPDYRNFGNKELKRYIQDLEDDFDDAAKRMFLDWNRTKLDSSARWLSARFDQWAKSGFGIFELGRVYEVEKEIGLILHRREIDCPLYAQVLLQGFQFSAIRHPEYHLARDLALLYNLFLDSDSIANDLEKNGMVHNTEHNQSLGRSVILTCFNLLESFLSGIAAQYLIENPSAPAQVKSKLEENLTLRKRLIRFPDLVTGKSNLVDDTKPPFKELLGECKRRRDSFVHCEPGSQPTKWGYVKEENFHDIDKKGVLKTIKLTIEVVCYIWKHIHNTDKPSWLPTLEKTGRFDKVAVSLQLIEMEDIERIKSYRARNDA